MSSFRECERCKEYIWEKSNHQCYLFVFDYEGEEYEVYEQNKHDAAVKLAEIIDQDDYSLLEGESIKVSIDSEQWILTGESIPTYYASKAMRRK